MLAASGCPLPRPLSSSPLATFARYLKYCPLVLYSPHSTYYSLCTLKILSISSSVTPLDRGPSLQAGPTPFEKKVNTLPLLYLISRIFAQLSQAQAWRLSWLQSQLINPKSPEQEFNLV